MSQITPALLNSYLGRHIDDICLNRYQAANHCAHFVGHALNLRFGYTCGSSNGASLRVHEIFARCPHVEELNECRTDYKPQLMFVTGIHNVRIATQTMDNVPKKHIGIVCGNLVWHYSNTGRQVVSQAADQFIYHYRGQQNGLWLGDLPLGANPQSFGVCTAATD